jgi:rubrerythrin
MTENDLISRSALRKLYSGWIPQLALPEDERDKKAIKICIAVLDEAPTIDPESLRQKGRWEEHDTSRYGAPAYVCSRCYDIWESIQIKNMKYCPSCGAKMEG